MSAYILRVTVRLARDLLPPNVGEISPEAVKAQAIFGISGRDCGPASESLLLRACEDARVRHRDVVSQTCAEVLVTLVKHLGPK